MVTPDPDVNTSVGEVDAAQPESVHSVEQWAQRMLLAAFQGDAPLAASLLQLAEQNYAGDPALDLARARCHYILARSQALSDAMQQMRTDLEDDRFTSAVGRFREALCLSQGFPKLEEEIIQQAVLNAGMLLPRNWRVAETLLHETSAAISNFHPQPDLAGRLQRARVDELVTIAIYQADKAEFTGATDEARQRLLALISAHPGEKRLADRLRDLNTPRQVAKRTASTASHPAPRSPRPSEFLDDSFDWHAIKNLVSLGGATVMLGLAGFLIWHHFSAPASAPTAAVRPVAPPSAPPLTSAGRPDAPTVPPVLTPPASVPTASALPESAAIDEQAWDLVKTSDSIPSIKAFIAAYPSSPHALRARVRIAAIEWARVDKTDTESLEAYLRVNPHGFYRLEAKRLILRLNARKLAAVESPPDSVSDRDAIMSAVRAFRESAVGSSPLESASLDEPAINGDQATVRLRQPGSADTVASYSLLKIEGKWRVMNYQ